MKPSRNSIKEFWSLPAFLDKPVEILVDAAIERYKTYDEGTKFVNWAIEFINRKTKENDNAIGA